MQDQAFINVALFCYFGASLIYFTASQRKRTTLIAFGLSLLGLVFNLILLGTLTMKNGRLPLTNGYEYLLCFAWITVLLYLIYEKVSGSTHAGGIVILIAALLLLSSVFFASGRSADASPLVPALKSPWLSVHVLTAVVAYGCFALAAGLAVMLLLNKAPLKQENTIYRIVTAGFAMLSLSIVLGAIWAEEAWGSYWTWDPKETWALITWIIYVIYLHLHNRPGWRGRNSAWLVVGGFLLVLFTFFGVSLLMSGLHSYS